MGKENRQKKKPDETKSIQYCCKNTSTNTYYSHYPLCCGSSELVSCQVYQKYSGNMQRSSVKHVNHENEFAKQSML